MDYEKAYKEALERAKGIINVNPSRQNEVTNIMVNIFPELAESKDERIYNLIYSSIKNDMSIGSPKNKELALTWLEKQKAVDIESIKTEFYNAGYEDGKEYMQKPAEWSEEDGKRLESVIHRLEVICGGNVFGEIKKDIDWLKSLRPNHWNSSGKDEYGELMCSYAYKGLDKLSNEDKKGPISMAMAWLRHYKGVHWKPSEEQIDAITYILAHYALLPNHVREDTESLLDELKKL